MIEPLKILLLAYRAWVAPGYECIRISGYLSRLQQDKLCNQQQKGLILLQSALPFSDWEIVLSSLMIYAL